MNDFARLESRFLFTGNLVLETALHIGGGENALSTVDSPVLRQPSGAPYIPGSSLKGAFRSTVEKLAQTLQLPNMSRDALAPDAQWIKEFRESVADDSDEDRMQKVADEWPVTSLLFGNPYVAGRIAFMDAYPSSNSDAIVQRRDGVAIDRDSERAVEGLKYDYEVVAPVSSFQFKIQLDNPTTLDLQLTCLGLSELVNGYMPLGGKRSSGLGRCRLDQLQVYALEFNDPTDIADIETNAERLKKYLLGRNDTDKFPAHYVRDEALRFIETKIETLIQECTHA